MGARFIADMPPMNPMVIMETKPDIDMATQIYAYDMLVQNPDDSATFCL